MKSAFVTKRVRWNARSRSPMTKSCRSKSAAAAREDDGRRQLRAVVSGIVNVNRVSPALELTVNSPPWALAI